MKIALLTDRFMVGGGLEYLYRIAAGLPQHTFVICAHGGLAAERFQSLPNVVIETGGYSPAIVRRHAPDLLHFNHLRPLCAFSLTPGRMPLPSINTVHGIHLRRYEFLHGPHHRLISFARQTLERYCLAKVDINIALTQSDRDYLVTRLNAKRVVIIPNGIAALDPATLNPVPRAARLHFLVPARFDFQKGHDVLLHAIHMAQTELRTAGAQFDLLGDGPLRARMEHLAQQLDIADLARFHGTQTNVVDWMASTDCVVLPSRWEGLPFVLLEAGRQSRPVICSDAPGNREVTDHGRCGHLFRNEDIRALAVLLKTFSRSPEIRSSHVALFHRVAEEYSVQRMLDRLAAAYDTTFRR